MLIIIYDTSVNLVPNAQGFFFIIISFIFSYFLLFIWFLLFCNFFLLKLFDCSPSCSPLLTRLHSIAIFSMHTIQALSCSNFFFESHFLLFCLSHCVQYRHCVSQFFSLNHTFFCLSHHEPSQELSFLSLMMMGSNSSLPLFI